MQLIFIDVSIAEKGKRKKENVIFVLTIKSLKTHVLCEEDKHFFWGTFKFLFHTIINFSSSTITTKSILK